MNDPCQALAAADKLLKRDEDRIRFEASLRLVEEYHLRTSGYLPIPPTVEQMRFDGDRGL